MPSGIKAVFFDLDDTLCDDASAWTTCSQKTATLAMEYGPTIDVDVLKDAFFSISERYWMSWDCVDESRSLLEVRTAQWREALSIAGFDASHEQSQRLGSYYGHLRSTEILLFPDVIATVEALKDRGIKLAIITNGLAKTHVDKIEHLGLNHHFDHILIADSVGYFKPDPAIFHHALELCDAKPSEALMVGDHIQNDVGGAEAVGIMAFWFNPNGLPRPENTTRPTGGELRKISDLMRWFD